MVTSSPNHNLISSRDVEGTAVYDAAGERIGSIDHLMIDRKSGRISYAVMSFGGFMGLGESQYPLPWTAFYYDKDLSGYRTNVSADQVRKAPPYTDASWNDRTWESTVHRHYNSPPYWE